MVPLSTEVAVEESEDDPAESQVVAASPEVSFAGTGQDAHQRAVNITSKIRILLEYLRVLVIVKFDLILWRWNKSTVKIRS